MSKYIAYDFAESASESDGTDELIFKIFLYNKNGLGAYVGELSNFSEELEVLIKPNAKFRYLADGTIRGRRMITVEVIE